MTHENVYFANKNCESSKLADENANCWVAFERSYSYLRLLPAYSKIARTNVKVAKARLFALVQLWTQELAFNWAMNTELLKFKSLRWPKPSLLSSERYYIACKCCLSIFTKNKASHCKQRQLNGILCHCFTSLVFFLPSHYILMYFFEEFAKLRICLFCCVFCRNLAKCVISIQFLHYCCQRWSPWAIFTADK